MKADLIKTKANGFGRNVYNCMLINLLIRLCMKWLWYQVSVLETSLIKVEGNLLCTYDLLNNKYIHGTCAYFRFNYFSPLWICV